MKKFHASAVAVLMATLTATGLTACGGDDDEGPGGVPSVSASTTPTPTITDQNGNSLRLLQVGDASFSYDSNGRLTSVVTEDETYTISGSSFVLSYSDSEGSETGKYDMNIQLNGDGLISKISFTGEWKESGGDWEKSSGYMEYGYNGAKQLTNMSGSGTGQFHDVYHEDGQEVADDGWSKGSYSQVNTWTNNNLVSTSWKSEYNGVEDGVNYSGSDSENATFTYGSESNPLKQYSYYVATEASRSDVLCVLAMVGLHGVGPANLPTSLSSSWTEIENGYGEEPYKHTGSETYQLKYTLNSNGTIATEGRAYNNSTYYTLNYSYDTTRSMLEQNAGKIVKMVKGQLFKTHRKNRH